tara:strand:- start:6086 stop:6907 length:822 start_codon:yes stop_codon:yes gene_type:complete
MKKLAVIILNRNLPKVTDKLYNKLKKSNKNTDIYILESGSDKKLLSKNYTWHANWPEAKKKGLRFSRGMNYALIQLIKANKFELYDYFLLITNDTEFENYSIKNKIDNIFNKHKKLGVLSPCSKNWGEINYLKDERLKYFWFIENSALIIKRDLIKKLSDISKPKYIDFLFDGNNFRGFGLEVELITKAYINDYSAGITRDIIVFENETYLKNDYKVIKTDPYNKNLEKYVSEGKKWMKKKYGFNSKWSMQMYAKLFYDKFFDYNPEMKKYRL